MIGVVISGPLSLLHVIKTFPQVLVVKTWM